MTQDQNTQNYLSLFQAVSDKLRTVVQKLNWLPDVSAIPDSLLKWWFLHHGFPFPSWSATKRNLPVRFEEFHAQRHTVRGFVAWFSALTSTPTTQLAIDVTNAQPRSLMYLGVNGIGLPNAEMLAQSGQIDACFYLYKDQPIEIGITVEGDAQMAEFLHETAKLEVPFGDSPSCEITIEIV